MSSAKRKSPSSGRSITDSPSKRRYASSHSNSDKKPKSDVSHRRETLVDAGVVDLDHLRTITHHALLLSDDVVVADPVAEEEDTTVPKTKEIFFPKSEFEYDRSLEPLVQKRGFTSKMRELISSASCDQKPSSAPEEKEDDKRAEGFLALPPPSNVAAAAASSSSSTAAEEGGGESRFKGIWNVQQQQSLANVPLSTSTVKSAWIFLHNEILAYQTHVTPSEADTKAREQVIENVRSVAEEFWPKSSTKVFGSCATGLCLPDSDVDLCLFGAPGNAIFRLANAFKTRKMVEMIQVLDNANVPIVKLRFNDSPFSADISFDQIGGIRTATFIKKIMELMPEVRPLVLIVKHFLSQRDLNETYRGGMGSYLCFLTVVAVVQRARRMNPAKAENLGTLLLQYFDFYGNVLNYDEVGISLLNGGRFFKKSDRRDFAPEKGRQGASLWLEDPMNTESNIGSKAWKMHLVKHAFSVAHTQLVNKLGSFDMSARRARGRTNRISLGATDEDSFLANVIRLRPDTTVKLGSNVVQFSSAEEEEEEEDSEAADDHAIDEGYE